jgi:hypothetical protein
MLNQFCLEVEKLLKFTHNLSAKNERKKFPVQISGLSKDDLRKTKSNLFSAALEKIWQNGYESGVAVKHEKLKNTVINQEKLNLLTQLLDPQITMVKATILLQSARSKNKE